MHLILLSGGSGKRLWPLSNDIRSKQFLRLLDSPTGEKESMVQRIIRQLREARLDAEITFATSETQKESIINQIGSGVNIVTEPERRDTFPAIALAAAYLKLEKGLPDDETIVVMPCDAFTEEGYFSTISRMAQVAADSRADLVLMGIRPTEPSSKFGYIVPAHDGIAEDGIMKIERFTEKPDIQGAQRLLEQGALWNGGVFAFRLGYVTEIAGRYVELKSFSHIRDHYRNLPRISFDYEVAEKADSIAAVPYSGMWKDLGTWNALSTELSDRIHGNAFLIDDCRETTVINELSLPVVCMDVKDLIIVASNDGILISNKESSEHIKDHVKSLSEHPRYIEYEWGTMRTLEEYRSGNHDESDGEEAPEATDCRVCEINIKAARRAPIRIEEGETATLSVISGRGTATDSADTPPRILSAGMAALSLGGETELTVEASDPLRLLLTTVLMRPGA